MTGYAPILRFRYGRPGKSARHGIMMMSWFTDPKGHTMPLHDGAPFLAKMGTSTPRLPVGDWGHQPIAGAYADSEGTEVQVEAVTLTIEQAAAMNFPGEEPEKPKRAPRKTAAAGATTRAPRKRATPAAAE